MQPTNPQRLCRMQQNMTAVVLRKWNVSSQPCGRCGKADTLSLPVLHCGRLERQRGPLHGRRTPQAPRSFLSKLLSGTTFPVSQQTREKPTLHSHKLFCGICPCTQPSPVRCEHVNLAGSSDPVNVSHAFSLSRYPLSFLFKALPRGSDWGSPVELPHIPTPTLQW